MEVLDINMATEEKRIDGGLEDPGLFERDVGNIEESTIGDAVEVLALQDLDPALNAKMHLVNNVRPVPRVSSIADD